jgi:hypothetical protein
VKAGDAKKYFVAIQSLQTAPVTTKGEEVEIEKSNIILVENGNAGIIARPRQLLHVPFTIVMQLF